VVADTSAPWTSVGKINDPLVPSVRGDSVENVLVQLSIVVALKAEYQASVYTHLVLAVLVDSAVAP
jgi:hypothetical protein